MTEQNKPAGTLRDALLQEEPPNPSEYEEYRMNLETALNQAQRQAKIAFHTCWVAFLQAREKASKPLKKKTLASKNDIEQALKTHVFNPDFLFHRRRIYANATNSTN